MDHRGWIVVFGKPPRRGQAKTRLAADLGAEAAARLAQALLDDTWAMLGARDDARRALSTSSPDVDHGDGIAPRWDQGEGDLGARIERTVRQGLRDAPWVLCLGADAPHVPAGHLDAALDGLATHDAVLGPADDGGYWCLGLRRCPDGLLAGLPWSASDTFDATWRRLEAEGFACAQAPPWWDVDVIDDLRRLVEQGGAPRTVAEARRWLA